MIQRFALMFTFAVAAALASTPPSFHVEVTGRGAPMILIPGFASSGHTWDGTVAHYKDLYECHVLTLAGFAGQPAIDGPLLKTVRDDLAAYIRKNKLVKPVVAGHSLGGVVALWLASQEPDLIGPLVIVDSLPFLAGVMDPTATADSVKASATMMQKMYSGPATEQTEKTSEMAVKSMVTKPGDLATIMDWSRHSDRKTMGTAMYELMTTDLRDALAKITSKTLVIGTWIAYKEYATRDQVEANFNAQYAKLKNYRLVLADDARHFVMLDDAPMFYRTVDKFLADQ